MKNLKLYRKRKADMPVKDWDDDLDIPIHWARPEATHLISMQANNKEGDLFSTTVLEIKPEELKIAVQSLEEALIVEMILRS